MHEEIDHIPVPQAHRPELCSISKDDETILYERENEQAWIQSDYIVEIHSGGECQHDTLVVCSKGMRCQSCGEIVDE